jgi:phospholipid/cholesterol/gamma-HCH transport system substrate-binding protein
LRGSVARLDSTLASIQRLSSSAESMLASNKSKLNSAFDNAEKFTENLVAISDTLTEADLAGTINRLNQSLASVSALLKDIEQGKGSVGKILKDEKLYDNIEGATAQLEALLQDMKLNPKRYVHFSLFGKRPKSYDFEKNNYEELNQKQ